MRVVAAIVILGAPRSDLRAQPGDLLFDGATGAPGDLLGEAACTYPGGCHQSFALNSGPGLLTIEAPSSYTPGETYAITVDLSQTGQMRWGFELTVLFPGEMEFLKAGTLASTDSNTHVSQNFGRDYMKHTEQGTAPEQPNGNSWTFDWTAPDQDVGPVTFYAAGNAANNANAQLGDYIYTTNVTIPAPEPGSLASGLLGLSAAAALARWRDRPRWKGRPRRIA